MPVYSFENRVALVTGAGSGMGRSIALKFASAGAKVMVSDISEQSGRDTVESIRAAGGTAELVCADVSRADDVDRLLASAVDRYQRVDYACNAAGIDIERAPLADCDEAIFDKVIDVNLRGTFLCLKYEIRQMLRQESRGCIVNFAGASAYRSKRDDIPAYVASKAGLIAMTRIAAKKYARDGIRINTVCPGAIDTPMLRGSLSALDLSLGDLGASYGLLGRVGRPEEIAEAALWLCSEGASFTTGVVLPVDGGALIA